MQANSIPIKIKSNPEQAADISTGRNNALEIRCWFTLLTLANLGLLLGNVPASNLMFHADSITAGEWWRILTWPFVHVSRYHLLIDGMAFLLLYTGLQEKQQLIRISYALTAATGSLLLPLAISPEISTLGLCGLSGPAHGLLAISLLETLQNPDNRKIGLALLVGLLLKTGWELVSGTAFLHQWHLGDIGHPVVTTHAGGVIAAMIHYLFINNQQKNHVPQS